MDHRKRIVAPGGWESELATLNYRTGEAWRIPQAATISRRQRARAARLGWKDGPGVGGRRWVPRLTKRDGGQPELEPGTLGWTMRNHV
jgi:hypothetical protein